jgi:hypothetical protein
MMNADDHSLTRRPFFPLPSHALRDGRPSDQRERSSERSDRPSFFMRPSAYIPVKEKVVDSFSSQIRLARAIRRANVARRTYVEFLADLISGTTRDKP